MVPVDGDVSVRPLFPVGGRLTEDEQIGRGQTINELERLTRAGNSVLLFDVRRVGKSSLAGAVIDRARARGEVVVDLDLRLVRGAPTLATAIRDQLAALPALRRGARQLRRAVTVSSRGVLEKALAAMGAKDEAEAASLMIQEFAALTDAPDLARSLTAVERSAQLRGVRATVFLDEIHRVADWPGTEQAQENLAAAMRAHTESSLIFAGSSRRAVEKLFDKGKPLSHDGLSFPIPPISDEAWEVGLRERFALADVEISPQTIRQILAITDGHPQRTMAICAHAQAIATGPTIDAAIIRLAHDRARAQPSWNQ